MLLQGQIIAKNSYTNKLEVIDSNQATDKKGNVKVSMQVRGFYITAKIEISLKKTPATMPMSS
jgi:hydroxymethylglutaryl-CoA reductase